MQLAATALTVTGGTLALSGANTYTAGTIVDSGATIQVGNNSALGGLGGNSVTLNGGTLQAGATVLALPNAIVARQVPAP